jgi:hypothetical protein
MEKEKLTNVEEFISYLYAATTQQLNKKQGTNKTPKKKKRK